MSDLTVDMTDFHWVMQLMDTLDSGLVVIDRQYNVCVWNNFMQSYSGIQSQNIMGKNLFSACPDLPECWMHTKVEAAIALATKSFSSWEDRPYLFKFSNFSPVSRGVEYMYQDVVITPLRSLSGEVTHIALMINDVSDIAKNKFELRDANHDLAKISRTDGLTGLFNRSFWEECLKEQFDHAQVVNSPCSLVIFDIDHFKKVNDTYGHTVGDDVIRETASILLKQARKTDMCGRYGGEEFTAVLPDTTADQAHYFAERLRKRIEAEVVKSCGVEVKFTVSLGVCQFNPKLGDHLEWIQQADANLYHSKQNGRNRTTAS